MTQIAQIVRDTTRKPVRLTEEQCVDLFANIDQDRVSKGTMKSSHIQKLFHTPEEGRVVGDDDLSVNIVIFEVDGGKYLSFALVENGETEYITLPITVDKYQTISLN